MAIAKGVCDKCKHKETCARPCWFLETLLSEETIGIDKPTGNEITYYGVSYWEKRFSEIFPATLKRLVFEAVDENQVDPENPPDPETPRDERFDDLGYTPQQKTADIFYMRFFQGKSYREIGKKYAIGPREAANVYGHARKRVIEIIEALDGRDRGIKFCVDRARNGFTNHQKAFLLNKVFGVSFPEIAALLGYKGSSQLSHKINAMTHELREKYFLQGG